MAPETSRAKIRDPWIRAVSRSTCSIRGSRRRMPATTGIDLRLRRAVYPQLNSARLYFFFFSLIQRCSSVNSKSGSIRGERRPEFLFGSPLDSGVSRSDHPIPQRTPFRLVICPLERNLLRREDVARVNVDRNAIVLLWRRAIC